jgi:hypothetical protein
MIKLTKREWEIMKRPIYPEIQFVAQSNMLQIQTMISVGENLYKPLVKVTKVDNINHLVEYIEDFKQSTIIDYTYNEEDTDLHLITE